MMNIDVKGYNVNYIDKGEGPTVVLLHGWGSSCGAFNYIINNFCDSFRMIAPDLVGFGQSEMLKEAWTVSDYIDFVFNQDSNGDELIGMIDALTTNKTDFFREADHFRYLYNTVLPQFYAEGQKDVRLWSAACSSGDEVYTLAMVMQEYIDRNPYTISNYHIVGSDISTKVLRKAMDCVYSLDTIDMIPLEMKRK